MRLRTVTCGCPESHSAEMLVEDDARVGAVVGASDQCGTAFTVAFSSRIGVPRDASKRFDGTTKRGGGSVTIREARDTTSVLPGEAAKVRTFSCAPCGVSWDAIVMPGDESAPPCKACGGAPTVNLATPPTAMSANPERWRHEQRWASKRETRKDIAREYDRWGFQAAARPKGWNKRDHRAPQAPSTSRES